MITEMVIGIKIIQPLVNKICEEYHMATLDMDKVRQNRKKKRERIWDQGKDGKFSWNDIIRRDIDQVAAEAENWDEFLIGVEERGYEIKQGAHILLKPPGMDKGRGWIPLVAITQKKNYGNAKYPHICKGKGTAEPVLELPSQSQKSDWLYSQKEVPIDWITRRCILQSYTAGRPKKTALFRCLEI